MSKRALDLFVWLGIFLASCGLVAFLSLPAWAQEEHRHGMGHGEYEHWASGKTANCCNNQDCHFLAQDEYRETSSGTELKVGNLWCPVKAEHFVTKGKSPDWSRPHACINNYMSYIDPCDRILCFMREGGT